MLLVLFLTCVAFSGQVFSKPFSGIGAVGPVNVSDFADLIINNVDQLIVNAGLEPRSYGDVESDISSDSLSGTVSLTNGILSNISSVRRDGDALMSYDAGVVTVVIPQAFSLLTFQFDYAVTAGDASGTGLLSANSTDVEWTITVTVDFNNLVANVTDFTVVSTGEIGVEFSTDDLSADLSGLLDAGLGDVVAGIVTSILHNNIHHTTEDIINALNAAIAALLPPDSVF